MISVHWFTYLPFFTLKYEIYARSIFNAEVFTNLHAEELIRELEFYKLFAAILSKLVLH